MRAIQGEGLFISDVNGLNVIHMVNKQGQPDEELLNLLCETGFNEIVLAFESADPAILRQYANNKWDPVHHNITALIRACQARGLRTGGNYMIGFPTETRSQIQQTLDMAQQHKDAGGPEYYVNVFIVMAPPGTALYNMAIKNGYLPPNFNPDLFNWNRAMLVNTVVPPQELEEIREHAWQTINGQEFKEYKSSMNRGVAEAEQKCQ